eukprot:917863-Prymnesium_polylepis.3
MHSPSVLPVRAAPAATRLARQAGSQMQPVTARSPPFAALLRPQDPPQYTFWQTEGRRPPLAEGSVRHYQPGRWRL